METQTTTTVLNQIIFNAKEIQTILANLRKVAKGNNILAVLDNVRITANKGKLTFQAGDIETYISYFCPYPETEKFDFLVNLKDLQEIVKLQKGTVNISVSEYFINISGVDLPKILSPDEWPKVDICDIEAGKIDNLKYYIDMCKNSTCKDELRPVMTGIYFDVENNNVVSTDAHKMIYLASGDDVSLKNGFIMPKSAINVIEKWHNRVNIYTNKEGSRFEFRTNNCLINFSSIEGKFPNYLAVIPQHSQFIEVDRVQLINALKMARVGMNREIKHIVLNIANGLLYVSCDDVDFNKHYKSNDIKLSKHDGENIQVGFNCDFMLNLLNLSTGDNVKISYSAPNRAALINDNMLLMPVMIKQ